MAGWHSEVWGKRDPEINQIRSLQLLSLGLIGTIAKSWGEAQRLDLEVQVSLRKSRKSAQRRWPLAPVKKDK